MPLCWSYEHISFRRWHLIHFHIPRGCTKLFIFLEKVSLRLLDWRGGVLLNDPIGIHIPASWIKLSSNILERLRGVVWMVSPVGLGFTAESNVFWLCLVCWTHWSLFQDSRYESLSESWIHFLSTIDKDILIRWFESVVSRRESILVLSHRIIP